MNRRARLLVPLAALCLAAALPRPSGAQAASLVRDILPPTPPQQTGVAPSSPHHLLPVQDKVFFVAGEPSTGEEVWVSDGTPAGTQLLKDVCPGPCGSLTAAPPVLLGAIRNVAFWIQALDENGSDTRLWRSDGTRAGTYALGLSSELRVPPLAVLDPDQRAVYLFLGSQLLFVGCEEEEGCEIWRTDGTQAGTRLVRPLVPGSNQFSPSWLTPLGSRALFFGVGADGRPALWSTDGTFAGTAFVRTLPGTPRLAAGGTGRIFFVIHETLWVSDGTQAGTRELRSFVREDPNFESVLWLRNFGGRAWFTAYDPVLGEEIWRSDGTAAGTVPATDFPARQPFWHQQTLLAASMTAAGGRLVFLAQQQGGGLALWSTAGTPASMVKIRDVATDDAGVPWHLLSAAGKVFFLVAGPGDSMAAWSTDGTPQGTARLTEVCRSSSCYFGEYRAAPGGVLFHVQTGFDISTLWFSDGTPAGTRRYVDLPRGVRIATQQYRREEAPRAALAAGGKLFFTAENDAHGEELWIRDGARGPVRLAANLAADAPSSDPHDLQAAGGKLFLVACGGAVASAGTPESTFALSPGPTAGACTFSFHSPLLRTAGGLGFFTHRPESDLELWRSDGTPGGTFRLTGLGTSELLATAELDGKLLFVDVQNDRFVLRTSDGSPAGTTTIFEFPGDTPTPAYLTRLGGEVYFVTGAGSPGRTLWRTDGRPGGTRVVGSFGEFEGQPDYNPWLVRFGPHVYFVGKDGELWRTDGTAAGTTPLIPSLASYPASYIHQTLVWRGHLYFFSRSGLWRTDGTEAGTVLLEEIPGPPETGERPTELTAAGNYLFFSTATPDKGRELWRTDGTPGGAAVLDLFPGIASSRPTGLREAAGRLYFAADDGVHGRELWQSDGTPAGTRLVQDLAPQGASSSPDHLTVLGDRLYFSADDGFYGRELWSLPLNQPGCAPASGHLCLNGGRFRVEIAWKDFAGNTGAGQAVPLTADTGYFWFFDPANVEVVVKVLDGQALNGHFWVFYGALSSVEYTLTVTDTQTGLRRRYFNPSGSLASLGDTRGFGPLGAFSTAPETVAAPRNAVLASVRTDPAAVGTCTPAPRRLCLGGGRFAVTASWKDFQGRTGEGTAVALSADTGYFWFFDPANVEVIAKALDGSALNGHFWFFYGALSSVEYTLTVTDTTTGEVKTYRNPAGRFASVADTEAF